MHIRISPASGRDERPRRQEDSLKPVKPALKNRKIVVTELPEQEERAVRSSTSPVPTITFMTGRRISDQFSPREVQEGHMCDVDWLGKHLEKRVDFGLRRLHFGSRKCSE